MKRLSINTASTTVSLSVFSKRVDASRTLISGDANKLESPSAALPWEAQMLCWLASGDPMCVFAEDS